MPSIFPFILHKVLTVSYSSIIPKTNKPTTVYFSSLAVEIAWDEWGEPYATTDTTMLSVNLQLESEVLGIPYDWSPEGDKIVYAAGGGLYVTTGKNRRISGTRIHWSPEGTHLIYTLIQDKGCIGCQGDSYNVVRVSADGSSPTNLTNGVKADCFSLSWR
ncbi:MAG: TolB family protein [Planctomycetota bacterium]